RHKTQQAPGNQDSPGINRLWPPLRRSANMGSVPPPVRCSNGIRGASGPTSTGEEMKILHLLYLVCARGFYRWAMREIDPLHPDVGKITIRQRDLDIEYRQILQAYVAESGSASRHSA